MTFTVHALASGSSGNATLVRCDSGHCRSSFLIDAGVSLKKLTAWLNALEIPPADLSGIVLTHEHNDHAMSAAGFARRFGVPIVANRATLSRVVKDTDAPVIELPTGHCWDVGEMAVQTFSVPHDAVDAVGVNVTCGGAKASLMTDLGSVSATVREAIRDADLLVCETNHDVCRLNAGPYPDYLKGRILSDRGHLSNEVAVNLMLEHLQQKGPCTIWLAHLSKINNTPKLASNYARATLKLHAGCPFVLDIAQRDKPSAVWSPGRSPLQLSLY